MREEIARLVFPVLTYGIRLKERLAAGERPDMAAEQGALRGLLGSSSQAAPWGAGPGIDVSHVASSRSDRFLGIRYALACWLDEIMIEASWGTDWEEDALEVALFQTRLRYHKFWEQARLAETMHGSPDAHEAFLLCVLLGFRGEMGDNPAQLREWVSSARSRVSKDQGKQLPNVGEVPIESNVPLLVWGERYQQMVKVLTVSLLAMVPLVTFLLVIMIR